MAQAAANPSNRAIIEQAARLLDKNALDDAERGLASVLAAEPGHPQALHLMGVTARARGKTADAEAFYRRSLAGDPGQPLVHHNLGNLLSRLGRHEEAAAALKEAVRLKPNYAEAHLALALALSETGDHQAAERSCRDALRYQPNYLAARQALATELCELDRPKDAEQLLRRALAIGVPDPRQTAILEHNLAMALKQQDRFEDALVLFDAAQAKAPDLPAVDYNRANTLQQLGRNEEAARAFEKAVARDPTHVGALAGYALASAVTTDIATARNAATRALALAPEHAIARIALAIADIEEGDFDAGDANLRRVIAHPSFPSDGMAALVLAYAADALERNGHFARAYEIYHTANTTLRSLYLGLRDARAIDDLSRLAAFFQSCPPWAPTPPMPAVENSAAAHVFILGFMRSGTTLLETVLSANPRVVCVDEIEFFGEPVREFMLAENDLDRLANLSPPEIADRRAAYWKTVRNKGFSVSGRVFVDKMPFNSLRLPLIARLFADASVIFAVRDPRDVVISCFRRRFNPTPFTYEYLELEDCARFYAAAMALADLYRKKLPLRLLEFRYEDMIADFDGMMGKACEFAGVDFDPAMRDFAKKGRDIDRRNPSAVQVRRGLYSQGIGQWRQYREQMEPVLPILKPWIERFGYSYE